MLDVGELAAIKSIAGLLVIGGRRDWRRADLAALNRS